MMNNTGMTAWFKSFQGASAKWRRRSSAERLLLMEAFLLLGIARLTVLVLPFKWLAVSLGRHKHEADAQISFSDLNLARKWARPSAQPQTTPPGKASACPRL